MVKRDKKKCTNDIQMKPGLRTSNLSCVILRILLQVNQGFLKWDQYSPVMIFFFSFIGKSNLMITICPKISQYSIHFTLFPKKNRYYIVIWGLKHKHIEPRWTFERRIYAT